MYKMYVLIAAISIYIRHFILPNPFEKLSQKLFVSIGGTNINLPPVLLNLIAEPILHIITFTIVGLYYSRGENAPVGSFLYLLFYCIHVGLIYLASLFGFAFWANITIVIIYIAGHVSVKVLNERISNGL